MKWRLALAAVLLLGAGALASCSMLRVYLASNREFQPLLPGSAIAFEPGAEVLARNLAAALPAAMEQIERTQGAPFRKPPSIYLCATAECYLRHTNSPERVRGGQVGGSLYLSPRLVREPATARGILTHELSHVHLFQYRGWRYNALPHWFQEGLAVVVSGGAGAEECSVQQAAALIRAGRHIDPTEPGGLMAYRKPASYGLQPHEFYRQGALFVGWMQQDAAAFGRLLRQVREGAALNKAFARSYGFDIGEGWRRMTLSLPAAER